MGPGTFLVSLRCLHSTEACDSAAKDEDRRELSH